MRILSLGVVCVVAVVFFTTAPVALAQNFSDGEVPRTADGHPDLQGVWANNNAIEPVILGNDINGTAPNIQQHTNHSALRTKNYRSKCALIT